MRTDSPEKALKALREITPEKPRIYAPGCSAEVSVFVNAFIGQPSLAAEMTFLGVWIPGVNQIDYAALHPTCRAESIFMSPSIRASFERGAVDIRPLSYAQAFDWLNATGLDAAILQVTPPDAHGLVSLGVCADFAPAVWSRSATKKIAHVNAAMPRPANAPTHHIDEFDIILESDSPVLNYTPPPVSPVFDEIARNIATLIDDGDTLQFGLGNVQLATLRALSKKRNLRIHSGMISDPVLKSVAAGSIANQPGAITTGVALGSNALYEFCAADSRLRFASVAETHAYASLAAIENFVAINSVIEIDLFGQANAEYLRTKQISGAGGLLDFLHGAAASKGGKPIIALASTAKGGAISRIIPKLASPSVSIGRADAAYVVTEHGIADLRGKTIDERAASLIEIADPSHRNDLQRAWRELREAL